MGKSTNRSGSDPAGAAIAQALAFGVLIVGGAAVLAIWWVLKRTWGPSSTRVRKLAFVGWIAVLVVALSLGGAPYASQAMVNLALVLAGGSSIVELVVLLIPAPTSSLLQLPERSLGDVVAPTAWWEDEAS